MTARDNDKKDEQASRDEELWGALGRATRMQGLLDDPRWSALASGTLSEEEVAALREEAETSEEARACFEAFQPLQIDVLGKLSARRRGAANDDAPAKLPVAIASASVSVPVSVSAPVSAPVPAPARRAPRWTWVLAAAAVIAAIAVIPLIPRGAPEGDAIPPYAVEILGGQKPTLSHNPGPIDQVLRLGPRSSVRIALRPETSVGYPVEMRAFIAVNGRIEPWSPPLTVNGENGIFVIAGSKESLFPGVAAGEVTLILAVGRAGELPADGVITSGAEAPSRGGAAAHYRVRRIQVSLLNDLNDQSEP